MLAKGKGYLHIEDFRKMFDLPEDAEITRVEVTDGTIVFHMVSAEEEKEKRVKFFKTKYSEAMRRYNMINKGHHTGGIVEGDLISLNELKNQTHHEIKINIDNNSDELKKNIEEEIIKGIEDAFKRKGGI